MKNWKRIAIIAVVGIVALIVSASFVGTDISSRAIVLALGVDYDHDNEMFLVTSEIVSSGGGKDQQVGTFSKIIKARGNSIATAINDIYTNTGMLVSLGQCQILLLGKSMYTSGHMLHVMSYFSMSGEYKDSSSVCCVDGEAGDIMQTQLPLSKSISFTLVQILKDAGDLVAVPATTITAYAQSSLMLSQTTFITLIGAKMQPTEPNTADQTGVRQVTYECDRMIFFNNHQYVATLNRYNATGYTLLNLKATGQMYIVDNERADDYQPRKFAVAITSKKVDIKAIDKGEGVYEVAIKLDIGIQSMRESSVGKDGPLHPLISHVLTDSILKQVENQVKKQAEAYVDRQSQYDCDCIGVYKAFENKYGRRWANLAKEVKFDRFKVSVEVVAKED